ncbi:SGNH/GDSL hydrolase family protein [Alteromonas sp. ZYF713]|nr:SGNH/GDSL hydrolase family protein [Alteromonas sp. ZYF713]
MKNILLYQLTASIIVWLSLEPVMANSSPEPFITSWNSSPQPVWDDDFIFPTKIPKTLEDQTVIQAIRTSLGGDSFKIEMTNAYGNEPVKLGGVTIGLSESPTDFYKVTQTVTVTFGGAKEATIQPGSKLLSDEIALKLPSLANVVISTYLPEKTILETFHWDGRQTNYIVHGDQTQAFNINADRIETTVRLFVSSLFVSNGNERGAIAVIGDSITDGATAGLDNNTRWTDFLAERLCKQNIAVFNAGISGARLLSDGMGSNSLARLERDVLSKPGVSSLIVLLGINDIAWPGTLFAPFSSRPEIDELIEGYTQLAEQTHFHGIKIFASTLPPFEGALPKTPLNDYYNKEKNALRRAVNDWIRSTDVFDGVIDMEKILQSPENPNRLNDKFDSGDHLHPGIEGNRAMAYGFDKAIFTKEATDLTQMGVND